MTPQKIVACRPTYESAEADSVERQDVFAEDSVRFREEYFGLSALVGMKPSSSPDTQHVFPKKAFYEGYGDRVKWMRAIYRGRSFSSFLGHMIRHLISWDPHMGLDPVKIHRDLFL